MKGRTSIHPFSSSSIWCLLRERTSHSTNNLPAGRARNDRVRAICMACTYPNVQTPLPDDLCAGLPDPRQPETPISSEILNSLRYLNVVSIDIQRSYTPVVLLTRPTPYPKALTILTAPRAINIPSLSSYQLKTPMNPNPSDVSRPTVYLGQQLRIPDEPRSCIRPRRATSPARNPNTNSQNKTREAVPEYKPPNKEPIATSTRNSKPLVFEPSKRLQYRYAHG